MTVKNQVLPMVSTSPAVPHTGEVLPDSKDFVVGLVLGPHADNNLDWLLATLLNFHNTVAPAKLVVFAADNALSPGSKIAIQESYSDFQCVPHESSTRELLQGCDVLVSLQDGIPLSILRAAYLHIPIITTAIRMPEAIRKLRNVKSLRQGDEKGLREALFRISEQAERKPIRGFAREENIAMHYSDTYLWGETGSHSADGPVPKRHVFIKRALFGAIPGRQLLEHGSRDRAQIALTIDDGPDPVYTPQILDIFRDHDVKATFFVVGGAAELYPDIVSRMKREGHEVGSHSYSHPYLNTLSWSGAFQEIRMTQCVLKRILGERCTLFRPPHGKLSLRSLVPAWAAGQHVVMWSVDLKDYRASTGEVEAQLERSSLSSGDVILYHGTNEAALKALPYVIKSALDKGREAVTISEFIRH